MNTAKRLQTHERTKVPRRFHRYALCLQRFLIEPESDTAEIQRLRMKAEAIKPDIKAMGDYMTLRESAKSEYQKQKLLVEIRPD